MFKFIAKRVLMLIPMTLVVSFIIFAVLRMGPVDPAYAYLLNSRIPATEEALELTRQELGLNKPFMTQYAIWLKNAVKLDFGISYSTKRPVMQDLLYYFPSTLKLAGLGMIAVILVSLPLGISAALRKGSLWDRGVKLFSFTAVSIPNFWFGFLLILIFSLKLKILPSMGLDSAAGYILPVAALCFMSAGINTRITRTSMLENLNARSVTYARIRGVSEKNIIGRHVLRNSFIPIITSLGMHFGELLGGAVVVETLFALPGVGRFVVAAINNHDYPVIQCFMIFMTIIFVLCNLFTDIIYALVNPKIRYGVANEK